MRTSLSSVGMAPAALRAAWLGAWAGPPSCCEGVTMCSIASEAPSATSSFLDCSSLTKMGTAPAAAIACAAEPTYTWWMIWYIAQYCHLLGSHSHSHSHGCVKNKMGSCLWSTSQHSGVV